MPTMALVLKISSNNSEWEPSSLDTSRKPAGSVTILWRVIFKFSLRSLGSVSMASLSTIFAIMAGRPGYPLWFSSTLILFIFSSSSEPPTALSSSPWVGISDGWGGKSEGWGIYEVKGASLIGAAARWAGASLSFPSERILGLAEEGIGESKGSRSS